MFRAATIKKIKDILDKNYLKQANFNLIFPDGFDEFILKIVFISHEDFYFEISKRYGNFTTSESPGLSLIAAESFTYENTNELFAAINNWCERIIEDYRESNPITHEFDSFKQEIQDRLKEHGDKLNEFFTREESNDIKKKLDEFEAKISENNDVISSLSEEIKKAHSEISALKSKITEVPRGIWYRIAGQTLVDIFKSFATSKEARDFTIEAAKKWLLPGPDNN